MKLKDVLKKGSLLVGGAFALTLFGGQANAATVSSQLFLGELNQWSDNSAESQNVDLNVDGFLGVGDTLRGTFDIQTVEDLSGGGGTNQFGTATVNELSGIFEIEVTSILILLDPDGSCAGSPTCTPGGVDSLSGDELANYSFGPNAAFVAEFGATAGTMIIFFEDTAPGNYDRTLAAQAAIEAVATDGTYSLELGFFGDGDELWSALAAPTDPSLGSGVAQGTGLGVFNFQVSIGGVNLLFADWVQVLAGVALADGLIDFNASGGISGTLGSGSFYDIFNNVDLVFRPIPEPTTIGLLGIGLLALGMIAARRRRSS